MERAKDICTSLLGPNAVADEKSETGTRLEVIGYTIDLDRSLVSIARKNFLTAVHGFMAIDLSGKTNLRTMQKLASWGSRYGRICRLMRPFCGALNRAVRLNTRCHLLAFAAKVEKQLQATVSIQ